MIFGLLFIKLISEIFVTDKPSSPLNLTAPEVLADSITLRWEAPEDNGGSEITGYVIEKREFNRRSWQEVTKVKDLECTIGKLLEGNQYYFRVFAQNEIGMSEPIELKEPIAAKNPFSKIFIQCFFLAFDTFFKNSMKPVETKHHWNQLFCSQ